MTWEENKAWNQPKQNIKKNTPRDKLINYTLLPLSWLAPSLSLYFLNFSVKDECKCEREVSRRQGTTFNALDADRWVQLTKNWESDAWYIYVSDNAAFQYNPHAFIVLRFSFLLLSLCIYIYTPLAFPLFLNFKGKCYFIFFESSENWLKMGMKRGKEEKKKGRRACCVREGVTKGAWTPEEDMILVDFITQNGHGTWRNLPLLAGFFSLFFYLFDAT